MLAVLGLFAVAVMGLAMAPVSTGRQDDDGGEEPGERESDLREVGDYCDLPQEGEPDGLEDADDWLEDHDGETEVTLAAGPGGLPEEPVTGAGWDGSVQTGTEAGEWMMGGAGRDLILGLGGADHLTGQDGDDTLAGGEDGDELRGGHGNDVLFGGAGDDLLYGEGGDDLLIAGAGHDEMIGGEGNDRLYAGEGDDSLQGGWGDDLLEGGAGADVLHGGDGNDVLAGLGDGTRDFLNGGTGDDVLRGGADDWLNGGEGADLFELGGEDGPPAVVEDFDAGEDALVVVYDGDGPEPELSQSADDEGVTLMADGVAVARVLGVGEIDLDSVRLVAA